MRQDHIWEESEDAMEKGSELMLSQLQLHGMVRSSGEIWEVSWRSRTVLLAQWWHMRLGKWTTN